MWVNMKPLKIQPHSDTAVQYTVGISNPRNHFEQKRNLILLKPGYQTSIKILPNIITTTTEFKGLERDIRQCRFSEETDGLDMLTSYSKIGCQFECALKTALSVCRCLPWFYPNNFTYHPICDMFGGYCFDQTMMDESNYKQCSSTCLNDCQETELTTLPNHIPIDENDMCREDSLFFQHFEANLRLDFSYQYYRNLIRGGPILDITKSISNSSLCRNYVRNYISFVTVQSSTSSVIKSERAKRLSFYDQLSMVGGILGLFSGMSVLSFFEVIFLVLVLILDLLIMIFGKLLGFICKSRKPIEDQGLENSDDDSQLEKEIYYLHVS